jgi:hypothetical protein
VTKYDFIFSNKISIRLARHALFWLAFFLLLTIQNFGTPLSGFISARSLLRALLHDAFDLPFCLILVYVLLYVFYPVFLLKERYGLFMLAFLTITGCGILLFYFSEPFYFLLIESRTFTSGQKLLISANITWSAISAGGLALIIKVGKGRLKQEKEMSELVIQKAQTELRLLKTPVKNDFIFKTLDDIYYKTKSDADDAPLMIMTLSELLSYELYESDKKNVPCKKELKAVKDFLLLLEMVRPGEKINLTISGNMTTSIVTPGILFNFIRNYFSQTGIPEKKDIKTQIDISFSEEKMELSIIHNCSDHYFPENPLSSFLMTEQERLHILFPDHHFSFKVNWKQLTAIVELTISLCKINIPVSDFERHSLKPNVYESA